MTIYTWLATEYKQYWEFVQYCIIQNIKHERKEVEDNGGNCITYIVVTSI